MSNRIASALRQMGPKLLLRGLILICVLVGAAFLIESLQFEELVERFSFSSDPEAGWLHGRFAYLGLAGVFTALGGPRQAISFFAAYFFGLWEGFAIALIGSGLGCLIAYGFARGFHDAALTLIRGRVDMARQIWARDTFWLTFILRLLPIGSNLLANLAAGASAIPLGAFLAGSLAGYVPQTLVFVLMGSGVNVGSGMQIAISVGLFAVSTLVGVWIYARYRKQLHVETAIEDQG